MGQSTNVVVNLKCVLSGGLNLVHLHDAGVVNFHYHRVVCVCVGCS